MRIVAVLGVACAAGCLSTPDPVRCPDADGDGWRAGGAECGVYRDCADDDVSRHPGALEDLGAADLDCNQTEPDTVRQGLMTNPIAPERGLRIQAGPIVYTLHEDAANQLAQLNLAGTDLLYTNPDNNERWSGVHVWENSFSTRATDDNVTGAFGGLGVTHLRITWSNNQLRDGVTTYTFVPDGRVVRGDQFTVQSSNEPSPPMGSSVTDYLALAAGEFSTVRWEEDDGTEHDAAVTVPGSDFVIAAAGTPGAGGFLCARTPGTREIGFAVAGPSNDGHRGLRASVGHTGQFALQYDWRTGLLEDHTYEGYTMMWAGPATEPIDCSETELRARAFLHPVAVRFDGAGAIGSETGDLGGDGFVENGGYWSLAATGGRLRFHMQGDASTTTSPDNLFRITGLPLDADPVVTRNGVPLIHGRDYFLDLDADAIWLYTAISLDADVIELITPAASCPTCGS